MSYIRSVITSLPCSEITNRLRSLLQKFIVNNIHLIIMSILEKLPNRLVMDLRKAVTLTSHSLPYLDLSISSPLISDTHFEVSLNNVFKTVHFAITTISYLKDKKLFFYKYCFNFTTALYFKATVISIFRFGLALLYSTGSINQTVLNASSIAICCY